MEWRNVMTATAAASWPGAVKLDVEVSLLQSHDFEVQVQHDTDFASGLMEIVLVSDLPEGECVSLLVSVGDKSSEVLRFYRTGSKHWVNLKYLGGLQ